MWYTGWWSEELWTVNKPLGTVAVWFFQRQSKVGRVTGLRNHRTGCVRVGKPHCAEDACCLPIAHSLRKDLMYLNNRGKMSKENNLRHMKIAWNSKSQYWSSCVGKQPPDWTSSPLCLQLCPVAMEHYIREYVCFSAEETWQSMSASARVGAYDSGLDLWVACGNAACRIFMKLIKLFYLFGIDHGLFFRDPVNLTDKAKIHLLIHSWVGCLCINIACMCLLGEGICSLGSVLRENSKLTHMLLQASPLSFSVADAVTDDYRVCSCLPALSSPAGLWTCAWSQDPCNGSSGCLHFCFAYHTCQL